MSVNTVYQYSDVQGRLIYVGVTSRNVNRMYEHCGTKEWWVLAKSCTLEHFTTRKAALDRERFLIQTYKPPFNTSLNPEARTTQNTVKRAQLVAPLMLDEPDRFPVMSLTLEDLKVRQRAWYSLPHEAKKKAKCVACGTIDSKDGPLCPFCKEEWDQRRRTIKPHFTQE